MREDRKRDYSDIINLPHPTSARHPRMSVYARAAQFAPFAALTGHGDVIRETGRMTKTKVCLGEDQAAELDGKLRELAGMLACGQHPYVTVTHFVPDEQKDGGEYREKTGHVVKIDVVRQTILFDDKTGVPIGNCYRIREK